MEQIKRCFQKNPYIISRAIGNEVVLVPSQDKESEKIYAITGSGTRIWELIDGKKSIGDIKRIITKEFKVELQKLECDLISFLKELEDKNIIKVSTLKDKGGEVKCKRKIERKRKNIRSQR